MFNRTIEFKINTELIVQRLRKFSAELTNWESNSGGRFGGLGHLSSQAQERLSPSNRKTSKHNYPFSELR